MKKFALIVIFLLVFLSTAYCVLGTTQAQTFDSNKAYDDYVFTQTKYEESYRDYETKKDAYLKNPTLTLKEEARVSTINMLKLRDDLHRVYLTAVRTKVNEIRGLTQDEKGGIFTRLDAEVLYYQGHKLTYTGNEPLEEVFKINATVEDHYNKQTLPSIYEALFMISYGQQVGIRQDNQKIYQSLVSFLNQKVADGVLIIDPFNRWILDITGLTDNLQKNENLAKVQIQKIFTESYNPASKFDTAIGILSQGAPNLLKLNSFVTEFMIAINNQI
jgi:hypothetical protein